MFKDGGAFLVRNGRQLGTRPGCAAENVGPLSVSSGKVIKDDLRILGIAGQAVIQFTGVRVNVWNGSI